MSAGLELGRHHRIHRDIDLFLLCHQSISFFYLRLNPFLEVSSDYGGANVHDPLLWDLRKIRLIREVKIYLSLVADELHHALERQVLVLRDVDILDLIIVKIRLPTCQDIFQEVDCRVVYIL